MTNHLIFSFRIFSKYKFYNLINWMGLSIGLASFLFIIHYVQHSYRFDDFHSNADRIYRLHTQVTAGGDTETFATSGKPAAEVFSQQYVDVESYARLNLLQKPQVKVGEQVYIEEGFAYANPEALNVFSFQFLHGDAYAFSLPADIIISQSLADKYFKSEQAVNQSLIIEEKEYVVRGVFADWPKNSHLKIQALIHEQNSNAYELQDWFNLDNYSYVLFKESIAEQQVDKYLAQFTANQLKGPLEGSGIEAQIVAQPLSNIYFSQALIDDVKKGNRLQVDALAIGALVILVIAGLNFINLSMTQSVQRSKEFYLKKILGVDRKHFLLQSAMESLVMTLLVLATTALLIILFMPSYVQMTEFDTLGPVANWPLLSLLPVAIYLFIFFANSYSVFLLPFKELQLSKVSRSGSAFKGTLMVVQFMIATIILVITFTVQKQINFLKNKELGFEKENIMIVDLPAGEDLATESISFKDAILQHSAITNASLIGRGALPGEENGKEIFNVNVNDTPLEKVFNIYRVDENYFDLLDIELAEGRLFQADRISDKQDAVIINQALARSMNWEHPVGEEIYYGNKPRKVIGVVQNFHNKSLHNLIEPIVFLYNVEYASKLLVSTGENSGGFIHTIWKKHFPETSLSVGYFDQFIDSMYQNEVALMQLLTFFSFVSLSLCLMGLFAIFSFQVVLKHKEMSIRRILGAGALQIVKSSARPFFWFIAIGICLAFPLDYWALQLWLQDYSYKINQEPVIFAATAFIVLALSYIIVSYHTGKVIRTNPALVLRDE